jgi:hypothetical protein
MNKWKKISANPDDKIKKKNQDYGSNDKIKNKLKFDKNIKNKNLKPKHWGPKTKYHKILNWRAKLKITNSTYSQKKSKTKIKIKWVRAKFENKNKNKIKSRCTI